MEENPRVPGCFWSNCSLFRTLNARYLVSKRCRVDAAAAYFFFYSTATTTTKTMTVHDREKDVISGWVPKDWDAVELTRCRARGMWHIFLP